MPLERLEDVHDRACERSAHGAFEHEDGEWRQSMQGRSLPVLRREEVTALLARQPGDDDPAHAHGAGARQCLGIDARADDQDLAGQADVDRAAA